MRYPIKILLVCSALLIGYLVLLKLLIPSGPGPQLRFQWRGGLGPASGLEIFVFQGDGETFLMKTDAEGQLDIPHGGARALVLVGYDEKAATQLFAIDGTGQGRLLLEVDRTEELKVRLTTDDGTPLAGQRVYLANLGAWTGSSRHPAVSNPPEFRDPYWYHLLSERFAELGLGMAREGKAVNAVGVLASLEAGTRRDLIRDLTEGAPLKPTFTAPYFGPGVMRTDGEGWAVWKGLPTDHAMQLHLEDPATYLMDPPHPSARRGHYFQGDGSPMLPFSGSFRLTPGAPRVLRCRRSVQTGVGGRLPIAGLPPEAVHTVLWSLSPKMVGEGEDSEEPIWTKREGSARLDAEGRFAWSGLLPGWKTLSVSWSPSPGEVMVATATVKVEAGKFHDLETLQVLSSAPLELSLALEDELGLVVDPGDPRLEEGLVDRPLPFQARIVTKEKSPANAVRPEWLLPVEGAVKVHGLPFGVLDFTQAPDHPTYIGRSFDGTRQRILNPQVDRLRVEMDSVGLEGRFAIPQIVKGFAAKEVTLRLHTPMGEPLSKGNLEAFLMHEGRVIHQGRWDLELASRDPSHVGFRMRLDPDVDWELLILPTDTRRPREGHPPNLRYRGPLPWPEDGSLELDIVLEEGAILAGKATYEDGSPIPIDTVLLANLVREGADPGGRANGTRPHRVIHLLDEEGTFHLSGLAVGEVFHGEFMGSRLTFEVTQPLEPDRALKVKKLPYPYPRR